MELYIFYERAIRELAPDGVWCLFNNSLEGMEWRSIDVPKPSVEDIQQKAQEMYDEYIENMPTGEPQSPLGMSPQ